MSNWEFALAIDIGNSRVVSAVARVTRGAQEEATVFAFGDDEHSAVSAVFVDSDGTLSFGSEAERLGAAEPERFIREFVHDLGDDVPIMVGEHAVRAEDLYARMCAWIVEAVTASEGFPPAAIAITHPTAWGGHRRRLVRDALERVGIVDAVLLTEAESAARHYDDSLALETGRFVAIYDLGGTRFDAHVLRKRAAEGAGCQPVGEQVSLEDLGGARFDELLFRQVMTTAQSTSFDDQDDEMLHALARLQREVTRAKETLSSQADATVPMKFPSGSATVRINRSEFEALIDASLEKTLDALDLAIESAGIGPDRLEAILLTGGSSRIPLVAQRLSERFNLPLIAGSDPKAAVALGAAQIAVDRLEAGLSPRTSTTGVRTADGDMDAALVASPGGSLAVMRPEPSRSWWPKSPILLTTAAAFIALAIVFSNTTAAGARWPDYIQAITDGTAAVVTPLIPAEPTPPPPSPAPPSARDAESSRTERASDPSGERSASRERTLTSDDPSAMPLAGDRGTIRPTPPADGPMPRNSASKPGGDTSATKPKPSSRPVAPAPAEATPDSTPTAETGAPTSTTAPSDTAPPPTTPPADSAPPADTTPAPQPTPPADPTPDPPAPAPADPPATDPAVEPTPAPAGGPAPEPTP